MNSQRNEVVMTKRKKTPLRLKSETFDLIQMMNNMKFYPPQELVKLHKKAVDAFEIERDDKGAKNPAYLNIAATCAKELMPYIYPKRKIIEVDPSAETKKLLEQMSDEEILTVANQVLIEGDNNGTG